MHFIVKSRGSSQQGKHHTVFFLSFFKSDAETLSDNAEFQQMWQSGLIWQKKGRKEARAKIPHQVFIKPRLMWSQQQQPLNLRLSATKAE